MSAYKCLSIVTGKLEMNVFEIPVHTGESQSTRQLSCPSCYASQEIIDKLWERGD